MIDRELTTSLIEANRMKIYAVDFLMAQSLVIPGIQISEKPIQNSLIG
jgi:hypothetical protein